LFRSRACSSGVQSQLQCLNSRLPPGGFRLRSLPIRQGSLQFGFSRQTPSLCFRDLVDQRNFNLLSSRTFGSKSIDFHLESGLAFTKSLNSDLMTTYLGLGSLDRRPQRPQFTSYFSSSARCRSRSRRSVEQRDSSIPLGFEGGFIICQLGLFRFETLR
jgi:hypothetical protein